ncbi:hypothetical protein HDU82_001954 [Entophlyctis luteolus]|nr:hypothetical protein HDU82_001954 [Entophlyctis luteolus]
MQAVVFERPFTVSVKTVASPHDEYRSGLPMASDTALVKVHLAGLCGSDLHCYRGVEPLLGGGRVIMGHEFVGVVIAHNSPAEGRPNLTGVHVIAPFTTSCLECIPCSRGFTSRCVQSKLFGSEALQGAQAEYVSVPNASGTLVPIPPALSAGVSAPSVLLCCDILPTGYFAALQALTHANLHGVLRGASLTDSLWSPSSSPANRSVLRSGLVFAVVGLGPVGLCALVSLIDILSRPTSSPLCLDAQIAASFHAAPITIIAVDGVQARRDLASGIVSRIMQNSANKEFADCLTFSTLDIDSAEAWSRAKSADARADAVLEAVGALESLKLSYNLLRPFGVISSIGVHASAGFPLTGDDLYNKNAALCFGRCPVRAVLPLALGTLERRQDVLGALASTDPDGIGLIDRVVPISEAPLMYEKFERREVGKVLFSFES